MNISVHGLLPVRYSREREKIIVLYSTEQSNKYYYNINVIVACISFQVCTYYDSFRKVGLIRTTKTYNSFDRFFERAMTLSMLSVLSQIRIIQN